MFHFRSTLLAAREAAACAAHMNHQKGPCMSLQGIKQVTLFQRFSNFNRWASQRLHYTLWQWLTLCYGKWRIDRLCTIIYHFMVNLHSYEILWKKNMAQLLINLAMKSYEKKLLVTNNLPVRPALGPRQGLQHDFLGALFVASLGAHYRPAIA